MASKFEMDWPKARLSLAYWDVRLITCFEPPTQDAPNLKRPIFKVLKATAAPLPTLYNKLFAGTLAF